jgi:hypothetical protein
MGPTCCLESLEALDALEVLDVHGGWRLLLPALALAHQVPQVQPGEGGDHQALDVQVPA